MQTLRSVPALLASLAMLSVPAASSAGVFLNITIAPPALPIYVQPPCPTDGYLWNPGYYAYGDAGYYWVPGIWVMPPSIGMLWTPPYWGFAGGIYGFHGGYWGAHVGFYGGVNYGFGYGGVGYEGGAWQGGHFSYNTAVTHVNTNVIHNTYNRTVVVNNNRASFNGAARPTAQESAAGREQHVQPTSAQASHERTAVSQARPAAAQRGAAAPEQHAAVAHEAQPQRAQTQQRPAAQEHQVAAARPQPQQQHQAAPAQRAAPAARPAPAAHEAPHAAAAHPAAAHEERGR